MIEDNARALVHFEVEPTYAGWTLSEYVAEKLKRPLAPALLELHPTARYHVSTLTRALETRHRNASGEKPDPAHRLDRETSGLVACGRSPLHTRALKAAFAARQVEKAYLALCEGEPRADE